jgi:uncharacterized membrane protein YeaQ/YmgE (transglycosylase-associated protein family)
MSFLDRFVDERYLNHRLRSTSLAGITGAVVAVGLFTYRFYVNHFWSWDLLAVILTVIGVKVTAMVWYHLTD